MSSTTKNLTDHARFIRNAAPQVYEDFCNEFRNYTNTVVLAVVHTTGDDLQRAQGRAQQCLKILSVLEEIRNG